MIRAEIDSARDELAASARRSAQLEFPQNAASRAHTYFMEIWICLEAGRLGEAAELNAAMRRSTEESGIDMWKVVSLTQHVTVRGLTELAGGADAQALQRRAEQLGAMLDAARQMQLNVYLTYHDGVIARLLLAAGHPLAARERIDRSLQLAEDTGMRFQEADLLRLRAHTMDRPGDRRRALGTALGRSREQGAKLFELRCLLDYFDLDEPAGPADRAALAELVSGLPPDPELPEWARAQRILR